MALVVSCNNTWTHFQQQRLSRARNMSTWAMRVAMSPTALWQRGQHTINQHQHQFNWWGHHQHKRNQLQQWTLSCQYSHLQHNTCRPTKIKWLMQSSQMGWWQQVIYNIECGISWLGFSLATFPEPNGWLVGMVWAQAQHRQRNIYEGIWQAAQIPRPYVQLYHMNGRCD